MNINQTKRKQIGDKKMARTIDSTSVRQRAFKTLDGMRNYKRKTAIDKLMEKYKITKRYAETIYATHREMGKESGVYTPVFKVMDTRRGKAVTPYMSRRMVFKPKKSDVLSPQRAIVDYIDDLKKKISMAENLI